MLLIDDAAQSFGGTSGGRPVGALAPVTATSFYPAKPLGGYGDGGALFTDDEARAARWRSIRQHGQGDGKYDIVRVGLNSRIDTLQAAILLVRLACLRCRDRRPRTCWPRSTIQCSQAPSHCLGRLPERRSTWAQYTIRLERRDEVQAALAAQGIPTAIHYPVPMHLQPAYSGWGEGPGSLPVSERLSRQVLCLPMHADLDEAAAMRIAHAVRDAPAADAAPMEGEGASPPSSSARPAWSAATFVRRLAERGAAAHCLTRRSAPSPQEAPQGSSWHDSLGAREAARCRHGGFALSRTHSPRCRR